MHSPNPFLYITAFPTKEPPAFAVKYGYESYSFLANMGVMFSVGVLVLSLTLFTKAFSLCPNPFLAIYAKEIAEWGL